MDIFAFPPKISVKSFEELNPEVAIQALKGMRGESCRAQVLEMMSDDISFVNNILNERYPQYRAESYPYVGQVDCYCMFHLDSIDCEKFIDKETTFKTRREVMTEIDRSFVFDVVYDCRSLNRKGYFITNEMFREICTR